MKPRYMDWQTSPVREANITPEPGFRPSVVVMPLPGGRWYGVWAYDDHDGHEEYEGSRSDVIAWARAKGCDVYVWSDELRDVQLIGQP